MKKDAVQQEILLVTATTFSNKHLSQRETTGNAQQSSIIAQIEEACWNGLLEELMPEIVEKTAGGKKLYLWNIQSGKYLLHINLAEFPVVPEKYFSIEPFFVLLTSCKN